MSLSKTLYPLLSTGKTQNNWRTSRTLSINTNKFIDWKLPYFYIRSQHAHEIYARSVLMGGQWLSGRVLDL